MILGCAQGWTKLGGSFADVAILVPASPALSWRWNPPRLGTPRCSMALRGAVPTWRRRRYGDLREAHLGSPRARRM